MTTICRNCGMVNDNNECPAAYGGPHELRETSAREVRTETTRRRNNWNRYLSSPRGGLWR